MARIILHVDMDAFFAAIEQLDFPELRGQPVIVGADPEKGKGRGVVSTASYEARKFGIHSAMPISQAYQCCPHGIFVPPRLHRYAAVSRQVMKILGDFSPVVEQLSIDEAFVDFTGSLKLYGTVEEIGRRVKQRIVEETQLTCSVGIAPSKFIAKIASDLEKPDGLVIVAEANIKEFLQPLPIAKMWGVGPKTLPFFEKIGIHCIGDLAKIPQKELADKLGKHGLQFWLLANGVDDRSVIDHRIEQKSMSQETTFHEDVNDVHMLRDTLFAIADDLARLLRHEKLKGRTITMKIRLADFSTFTRSKTIMKYVDTSAEIRQVGEKLFNQFDRRGKKVRLLGLAISHLVPAEAVQLDLFDDSTIKQNKIDQLIDYVRQRHGQDTLKRASVMEYHSRWYRHLEGDDEGKV